MSRAGRVVPPSPLAQRSARARKAAGARLPGQPRTAWLASLGHGVNDAYTAMIPALLLLLQLRFGLTESLLALLIFAFTVSSSLPGPFLGWLADRFGYPTIPRSASPSTPSS